jgi:hypothetical protein
MLSLAILNIVAGADSAPKLTFEPYKVQYQSYPWIDPGAFELKPTSGLTGNSRLNYLLYCETTGTNELNPIGNRFLPFKGNFMDGRLEATSNPESEDFGAFHMNRRNFFDGYLCEETSNTKSHT